MKKTLFIIALSCVLVLSLVGCGRVQGAAPEQPAAAENPEPPVPAETAEAAPTPAPTPAATWPVRQDGERFEDSITVLGMEETVHYEHLRNEALGFEMDYDYESFRRESSAERERFISTWDEPNRIEDYMDVTRSTEDAETVAAALTEELSKDFELTRVTRELERAGSCIRIEASVIKGTNQMTDQLQAFYIIPAPDGCRIAATHAFITESEGFFRRFDYMLNTLSVMERSGAGILTDEEAIAAIKSYCYLNNPDLESIVNAGEYPVFWELASSDEHQIVVLYRSYTGAELRYYIDRATGDAYVTEFVPGITPVEERTDESLNVWDYVSGQNASPNPSLSITGTWQTASVGYEADGTMAPEYYVMFTDRDILYGHRKNGEFAFDHSDRIVRFERTAAGGFVVQAEASNGVAYTYQTSETDQNVLEYYETWDEKAFPDMYRGGASLSRCD